MEDLESSSSSSSIPVDSLPRSWKRRQKADVYQEILHRLRSLNEEVTRNAEFETKLWSHFSRLPVRYAADVNVDGALDVLMHQRLLSMARDPATRPAIEVRLVQVQSTCDGNYDESVHSDSIRQNARCSDRPTKKSKYPPPAFSSSAGCEIGFDIKYLHVQDQETTFPRSMHEITISTVDKPKLLSQLTTLISELGLNIQEAHAFSTVDGYSLDVFVVDGWALEGTKQLKDLLIKEISKAYSLFKHPLSSHLENHVEAGVEFNSTHVNIPIDGAGVWEIDVNLLTFEQKIASGSCSDLYKGYYCGQVVAIKLLRVENLYEIAVKEFIQEVNIMRKVRHKNVVQFIGACTRSPSLCIITGGSMYDFLRRHKGVLTLSSLVRVAIEVSKGMNYLHQNNIMHRDLKAANLLVDEDGVVKLADFGVAKVQVQSGVMTAETGTYRWMAPEIIEHKPYDHKADVFSFGIVLWELLTCKLPYEDLTPLQAAVGVAQKGLRPIIPQGTHPLMVNLMEKCWQQDPSLRPEFFQITELLLHLSNLMKIVLMAVVLKITSIQGVHSPERIQSLVKLYVVFLNDSDGRGQETEGYSKIRIEVPAKGAQYSPENLTRSVSTNTEIPGERHGAADLLSFHLYPRETENYVSFNYGRMGIDGFPFYLWTLDCGLINSAKMGLIFCYIRYGTLRRTVWLSIALLAGTRYWMVQFVPFFTQAFSVS